MAVACENRPSSKRRPWAGTQRVDIGDLRVAGGLMLLLSYIHPLLPFELGILCPLRAVTGIPCPLCGMTTSVTAATHLDFMGALAANPMGVVAVFVALYLLIRRPDQLRVSTPLVLLALAGMWLFELNRYAII